LIGEFDLLGFYYPLEQDAFPDHFGSMTAFITAILREEIKAVKAGNIGLLEKLQEIRNRVYTSYLKNGIQSMLVQCKDRLADPFFQAFMPFFQSQMEEVGS
jgi:hypothetical protein